MQESDLSEDTDISPMSDLSVQEATAQPGAWLSKRAAATALGVSEKTIERRVNQNQLQQRTVSGGRVEIWVDGVMSDVSEDSLSVRQEMAQDASSVALAVVQQYTALVERIEFLSAENGRLRAELDVAEKRLSESSDRSDKPPARRPWWRWW